MNAPIIVVPPPVNVPNGHTGGGTGGAPLPMTLTQWLWFGGLAAIFVALVVTIIVIEVRDHRARKRVER